MLSKICEEITKIEKEIQEETKRKQEKEKEGNGFIKGAREDLQKMCKMLLQKKLEHEDLKAEKVALIQEINMLKDTCDNCKDRCAKKQQSIFEEIKNVDTEIYDFKLKCVRCNVCIDTSDVRKFCIDCPRCEQQRECLMEGGTCSADAKEECVCMTVKQRFLDNVFENMYTVLEKQIRTDAGKVVAEEIADCLKKSRNGKLNEHTRRILQDFILTTVKKNLNLTIVGGAVKTRCELDTAMYEQLMLCLKKVKATPTPKSDKGTDVKKDPCFRWGGPSECNCPKGPKACICSKKAPPPVHDPTPCPPPEKEDAGEIVVCPHKQNVACGPDCGSHTPNKVGKDVAKWRPDPCAPGQSCPFGKNMRAAQCVLGPESLIEPIKFGVPTPQAPSYVLQDQIECKCGKSPMKPCTCSKDKKLMKAAIAKNCLRCVVELPQAESIQYLYEKEKHDNEKGTDPIVVIKRSFEDKYIETDQIDSFFVNESNVSGAAKPIGYIIEYPNPDAISSESIAYKVSTPGYSPMALKAIKDNMENFKKSDSGVESDLRASEKRSADLRLAEKQFAEMSESRQNKKPNLHTKIEQQNVDEDYEKSIDKGYVDKHYFDRHYFNRKHTKSTSYAYDKIKKEKSRHPTWNEEIARIVEETVFKDEKAIKKLRVCREPYICQSIDAYKNDLKSLYDQKMKNIAVKVDGENGLSTKITTSIIKTSSGNFALDISAIKAVSKFSNKLEEQPVLLKRSPSGTFAVYVGRLSNEDKGPNAVLRRTRSGRFLLVVTEPIFKSISTTRRSTTESIHDLFKVSVRDSNGAKDIPAVLEATPSFNYIFIVDKEFQRQHVDYLNSSLEKQSACYINLQKTRSNILLSFDANDQNALLVKTNSGRIKILVNGPVYENLSESTTPFNVKQYENLVNQLPNYKNKVRNDGPFSSSNCSKVRSNSDSNLLNKIKVRDSIFSQPSAKLQRTASGQYTVILEKESMKTFIFDLKKYLSLSPHGLIPIRKTDSGEITIHLNVNEEGAHYGVLKLTPSGNIYVLIDENDIKYIPKDTKNKITSTSCKLKHGNSCVCEPLKCACDSMQNYFLERQKAIGIKFNSFRSVTCGHRLKMRKRDKTCGKEDCDPKECLAGCCSELDENDQRKPCTCSSEPNCDTGAMEHCYYLTQSEYNRDRATEGRDTTENVILDISGFCNQVLQDLKGQDSLHTVTSRDSSTDEGWDSMKYLPPQLPSFLQNLSYG
ncbi:uncharacterized protein LOC126371180 isoform X2 [Pectinophora gossypiella]|uniref:uncharacterized protein LOC126371180 isoform X2 n=1 Tax=Pectinophora gossypiella TaxID=13191 RepID=UPI00214E0A6F|nr:uncharacterized protein LOC126371180 isoform X2 [Pectinophora gossypiella]